MSKNLIPKIAKMLGIEIGEEFKIKVNNEYDKDYEDLTYTFTESQGLVNPSENYCATKKSNAVLIRLLRGEYDVVKLLWKPKDGENYWTFNSCFIVIETCWDGSCEDYMRLKCGVVFRNSKEAIEKLAEAYKEITGEDWE